jgi:site-specific DNA recombinase
VARLVGYLRVSHVGNRPSDRFHSPAEQTEEIEAWAMRHGHEVHFLDAELDAKGANPDRPILRQAVEGIKDGRWDGMVVAYLSRAGRDLRLMLDLWDEVEAKNVGGVVYFARENIDGSTSHGRMQRNILASVAQYELEERREGFERAAKGATEAGIWQRRQTPRGYSKDPETRRLVPNDDADSVRQAAADYLSGVSLVRISRKLGMTASGVRAMLRNRVYLGELKVRSYVKLKAHEPILDPGTFEAVQAKLASASRPPRSDQPVMLLAGLARCAACGHIMTRSRSHQHPIYRCVKNHSGVVCPAPAGIICARIEPYVEEVALLQLERMKISATMACGVETAHKDLGLAEAELSSYLEAVDMAGISAPDAAAGMRKRRERVEGCKARLQREQARIPTMPVIESGAEIWRDLNPAERNELLRSLLSAVGIRSVGPGVKVPISERVRIWSFGADLRLPGGRNGTASGIVPLPWPDVDGVDVLGISGGKDSL